MLAVFVIRLLVVCCPATVCDGLLAPLTLKMECHAARRPVPCKGFGSISSTMSLSARRSCGLIAACTLSSITVLFTCLSLKCMLRRRRSFSSPNW